jgi:predicted Rossmann fold flavoprotein
MEELSRKYPRGQHFVKKAFHWFNTNDTIAWFLERGVKLVAEKDGRMFPDTNDSATIIHCLLKEADKYGIEIKLQTELKYIEPEASGFSIHLAGSPKLAADYLCVACGGYPKPAMFDWLKQLKHTIETPLPSLFTFNMPGNPLNSLMGVSVENALIKIAGTKLKEQGPLLITHWGMSGPAILKLSAWGARILADMNYQFQITVNWLPEYPEQELRKDWTSFRETYAAMKMGNKNPFNLPSRLWIYHLECSNISPDIRWADLPAKHQNKLISQLTTQIFEVKGKTTFKEEFVTCGGIRLSEINPNTMESKTQPNLFFAGEVMDVDGITGGFNFQHAWTSGWIAARAISLAAK